MECLEKLWLGFPETIVEPQFGETSQLYAFTTENLTAYFGKLVFDGATVLTVGGSGDHVINAYFYGAKEVSAFDVNVLSKFFVELKLAALRELDRTAFLRFFLLESNAAALDRNVYEHLQKSLSDEAQVFFERAYEVCGKDLRRSPVFNTRHDKNALKIKSNPYLQSDITYQKAQEALREKDLSWFVGDDRALVKSLGTKQYDIVLLSNIADYVVSLEQWVGEVVVHLLKNVNPKGTIVVAYAYDTGNECAKHGEIDDPTRRREVIAQQGCYEELFFDSVIPGKKDGVILLKQTSGGN